MPQSNDTTYNTIAGIYVSQASDEVTSADKFYSWLRDTPNYVPRRIARDIWNQYQAQTLWADYRDRMDPDQTMSRSFFSDITANRSQTYNVKVKFEGTDPATGEDLESYMILGFDHAPTLNEVENWSLGSLDYQPPLPIAADVSWSIEYMYHRSDRSW